MEHDILNNRWWIYEVYLLFTDYENKYQRKSYTLKKFSGHGTYRNKSRLEILVRFFPEQFQPEF